MSYQRERDQFIARAAQAGMPLSLCLTLLRYATTLQRLAVAECNGDWPADNGERKTRVCPQCECGWAPSSFARGLCPECRTKDLVSTALQGTAWQPYFQGDPRGAVLQLFPAGTAHDDMYCGRVSGLYVPPRER